MLNRRLCSLLGQEVKKFVFLEKVLTLDDNCERIWIRIKSGKTGRRYTCVKTTFQKIKKRLQPTWY